MEHPSLNVLAEQSRPIQQGLLANAVLYLLPLLIAVLLGTWGAHPRAQPLSVEIEASKIPIEIEALEADKTLRE